MDFAVQRSRFSSSKTPWWCAYPLCLDSRGWGSWCLTIMEMVKEMDAGDMISRRSIPITDGTMLVPYLRNWLLLVVICFWILYLPILLGEIKPEPQGSKSGHFLAKYQARGRKLDWTKSNRQLFNQIRGMNPWPVAHTF